MDYLEAQGALAESTRVDLVGNRLVLIGPADDPAEVEKGLGLPEEVELPPSLAKHGEKVSGLLKRINRSERVAKLLEISGAMEQFKAAAK